MVKYYAYEIRGLGNMIKVNTRYFSIIYIYQKLIQGTNCYLEGINLTILSIMVEKLCVMRCIYSEDVLLGNNKNKQNKLNSLLCYLQNISSRDVKYIKSTLDIKEKNIFAQK